MGPQFSIYNKLKKMDMLEVALSDDGYPIEENVATFYSNPNYPIHISGLDTNSFYKCIGKKMCFTAGDYEEYEEFLMYLSYISGFKTAEDLINFNDPAYFKELVNFSRQEGTIGPIVAKKLFHDFRDNFNIAACYFEHCPNGYKHWIHYQNWCAGLYIAQDDGAIMII